VGPFLVDIPTRALAGAPKPDADQVEVRDLAVYDRATA
jgi:hypothetical protein